MDRILVVMKMDEDQRDMLKEAAPDSRIDFVNPKELNEEQAEAADVLTFTDKKEQSLAIIIVARLFRSQSRKASVVL